VELVEVPAPEPGPGQVRVRVEGCGLCGSNLPTWEGRPWFEYPLPPGAPGHEGWGTVDAVGRGVSGVAEGERVACLGASAFAELEVVAADAVLPLPAELDGAPFPGEPLACAVNVFRRSDVAAGMTVAVIGVGFLGAVLVRLAAHAGARVVALTRRPFALDVARRMGAAHGLELGPLAETLERARAANGGALFDRVLEVVGAQDPLTLAGQLTRERGRLVIAGYHQDGPRQVDLQLWNWRGLDVVNAHERDPAVYRDGMRLAVRAAAEGVIDVRTLTTHRFPLARLADAFEAALARPDGFLKAWVAP
jgi:threonine dehydrogenase-like Zn-dependent dehydrogenase